MLHLCYLCKLDVPDPVNLHFTCQSNGLLLSDGRIY